MVSMDGRYDQTWTGGFRWNGAIEFALSGTIQLAYIRTPRTGLMRNIRRYGHSGERGLATTVKATRCPQAARIIYTCTEQPC